MVTKRQARRRLWVLLAAVGVLSVAVVVGLLGPGADEADRSGWQPAEAAASDGAMIVATAPSPAATANRAARRLLAEAPVAVLVESGDGALAARGLDVASELGAPLLFAETDAAGEDDRLGLVDAVDSLRTAIVVTVGGPSIPAAMDDVTVLTADAAMTAEMRAEAEAAPRGEGAVVFVRPEDRGGWYSTAAIKAAGHDLVRLSGADPRADTRAAARLERLDRPVVAMVGTNTAWGGADPESLRWQGGVARRGVELPGGGQLLFPYRVMVAMYGAPGSGDLGVLGEQGVEGAIARAGRLAAAHQPFSDVPVVPAFELIATVATAGPGTDGDYSRGTPRATVEEWVEAAGEAGVYVVLDLQPGRADFLSQAVKWRDLLSLPHVGLALDPEWRLAPDEEPLEQVGSVAVEEVNEVVHWLADLTRNQRLPQKLLLLHQFNLDMIENRSLLDTSRGELSVVVQMDGQGTQAGKLETWEQIRTVDPPTGVWWGWKNFYDEDAQLRSPADTLGLQPVPVFVSYQ